MAQSAQVKRTLNFGAGQRICIGMPLAKMILPTNLALLLSHFSFRLADKVGLFKSFLWLQHLATSAQDSTIA